MEMVGGLVTIAAAAVFLIMRWRYVTKPRLSFEKLEQVGDQMLRNWRRVAKDIGIPFSVPHAAWRTYDVTDLEALEVARYLISYGKILAPNFDIMNIFNGQAPTSVALTRNSWDEYTTAPATYAFNGPTTFNGPAQVGEGGVQYNGGEFNSDSKVATLAGLDQLALALYSVADRVDRSNAESLVRMADTVSDAASSATTDSSRLRSTLRWLADRANDATGELLAAGVTGMAGALLAAL